MFHILIADDESKIRELIRKYAEFDGHEVTEASDGMEAVSLCRNQKFDVIILDVMMPHLDGMSACREIRKISDAPIILLTARSEEYDKIGGFQAGADDYVVKPFSPKVLMLRIEAIMKRVNAQKPAAPRHECFVIDGLSVDLTARIVKIDEKTVDLSPKEYDLLFYMIRNKGIALSRDKLLSEVWGYDFFGDDRTLDTHVKLLRHALGDYGKLITTLRGVGYRFENK